MLRLAHRILSQKNPMELLGACAPEGSERHQRLEIQMLAIHLDAAVPLWIERFRDLPEDERLGMIREIEKDFPTKMEYVIHRQEGKTAEAFNDLARAIALLSFCPEGVTCFGRHWETRRIE